MRLLRFDDDDNYTFSENFVGQAVIPPYAILSHTWGADGDEITYKDVLNIDYEVRKKPGFKKLQFCARQAKADKLEHFWIDTCCIDKSDSTELNEAINSMFSWYAKSKVCYVYLTDVHIKEEDCKAAIEETFLQIRNHKSNDNTSSAGHDDDDLNRWYNPSTWGDLGSTHLLHPDRGAVAVCHSRMLLGPQLQMSRWFKRGFTLQELLAPRNIKFYSSDDVYMFNKDQDSAFILSDITGIPRNALLGSVPLSHYGVDERFNWVASRKTTREEDIAYCMLGIFNVFIPLIYGEGEANASYRLRRAIKEKEFAGQEAGQFFMEGSSTGRAKREGLGAPFLHGLLGGIGGSLATLSFMASTTQLGGVGLRTATVAPSPLPSSQSRSVPASTSPGASPASTSPGASDTLSETQMTPNGQSDSQSSTVKNPVEESVEAATDRSTASLLSRRYGCTVEVRLRSYTYRLPENDLLRSLRELFPLIPDEAFRLARKDGCYQVWLPRELTEAERARITTQRVRQLDRLASFSQPSANLSATDEQSPYHLDPVSFQYLYHLRDCPLDTWQHQTK
ncbi:Heterokaryon incompatibility protein (HET) domain containing protein [Naviculisporaceae sp. PSN 640]